jgi:hypothetical protein
MTALWPLQVAIVARLRNAGAVTALVGDRITDGSAPDNTPMPYVVIGESTTDGRPLLNDARGEDNTLVIHTFSRTPGRKQTLEIVDAIDTALRTPLSVPSWGVISLRMEFATVLVDEDGIRHAAARYRATMYEA